MYASAARETSSDPSADRPLALLATMANAGVPLPKVWLAPSSVRRVNVTAWPPGKRSGYRCSNNDVVRLNVESMVPQDAGLLLETRGTKPSSSHRCTATWASR